ncbi:MAG: hypothetical protein HGB12_14075 [Bacteroidetes bacterium]|nr:hypothetical protein [Bacteroidota bacterium]
MKQDEKIIKNNILIAEFMGGKPTNALGSIAWDLPDFPGLQLVLFYDSSWDWLMPVINAIEKIGESNRYWGTLCKITTTYIEIGDVLLDFKLKQYNTKIQGTWMAVVEFIKQYNKTKKKFKY